MLCNAIKRGYGCAYVCFIIKQISSTQLLVCVSWSAPGSVIKEAPRDVWVCLCAWITHIHTPISTFGCVAKHIFLFHVYRSVSLARMRRDTKLAYLFHQCATSLLSRDSRIADCTVRHPGVERLFSSYIYEIVYLCKQKRTTLHSCRKKFSSFVHFNSFFVLLTWSFMDIVS